MRNQCSIWPYIIGLGLATCLFLAGIDTAHGLERRINTWSVLGPFDAVPGKSGLFDVARHHADLEARLGEQPLAISGKEGWQYFDDRLISRNQDDYNDLFAWFFDPADPSYHQLENKVAYCATHVWAPADMAVDLRFDANDQARVWLNGRLVIDQPQVHRAIRDRQVSSINLNAGWNQIVVKVMNHRRIWGFYMSLTDADGRPLEGLEYSPVKPEGALEISTEALPEGYRTQPYVWLEVFNPLGEFPMNNPSASPFRLLARGGEPPYEWSATGLPAGLHLDVTEGELLGKLAPDAVGDHELHVSVSDARGARAEKKLNLAVLPRASEGWFENGSRFGSLRHHGEGDHIWLFDHVEEQVEIVRKLGYSWIAYTYFSKFDWDDEGRVESYLTEDMKAFHRAFVEAGIKFCLYMSLKDERARAENYKVHYENMHAALEQHLRKLEPAMCWFDEMYGGFRPEDLHNHEFDALYSLIRTINPEILININAEHRARDYEVGDIDIVQIHGAYKTDCVWGQWPPWPFGNNPKYLPMDSWRMPWIGYMDPVEWCKMVVTYLAEPVNQVALRSVEIDWTPTTGGPEWEGPSRIKLLNEIGDWITPRKASILGTYPYSFNDRDWGYDVINPDTGKIYLHVLSNPRGKTGMEGGRSSVFLVPVRFEIESARLYPDGKPLDFDQNGEEAMIHLDDVEPDPASTIIEITPASDDIREYWQPDPVMYRLR